MPKFLKFTQIPNYYPKFATHIPNMKNENFFA
ncbi:MAG: hypothetical protein ACI88Z_001834, partial [Sphingobacteriales bacterium]